MTPYAVTAQFHDALRDRSHENVHASMVRALADRKIGDHPIIDIGAGTGLTTEAIARAVPENEIYAVEPDAAMRPALMTRITSDPDLCRRVSILPSGVLEAPLPSTISAAVAGASLVHFAPTERTALWLLLAERLPATGCALIEIQCAVAVDIPEQRMPGSRVGRVDYEAWASARRITDDRQLWRMTYVARLGDVEIDRQIAEFACWTASAAQVLSEAKACGLTGSAADGFVILHKS